MQKKIKSSIYVIAIVLILASFIFVFLRSTQKYFVKKNNYQNNVMLNEFGATIDIENKSYAIEDLKKEIKMLEDKLDSKNLSTAEESSTKLLLGYDKLFMRESNSDVKEGAKLLKEVVSNEKYPAQVRAEAIYNMTLIHENVPNYLFAVMYYFDGKNQFFDDIWAKSDKDVSLAFAKLNELSDELYSNAVTNYWIASIYGYQLYRPNISEKRKELYVAEIKKRLKEGDELLAKLENTSGNNLQKALAYQNKALALSSLYFNQTIDIESEEIKNLYEKAIQSTDNIPVENTRKTFSHYPRYYYATFLTSINDNESKQKISELLSFTRDANIDNFPIYYYLGIIKDFGTGMAKNQLDALSKVDADFKQLMEKIDSK